MKINETFAEYSPIVAMDEKLNRYYKGKASNFLPLHRAVNDICTIDIHKIASNYDFNSIEIQTYPPVKGRNDLIECINNVYFNNNTDNANILIIPDGISGVDLTVQVLNTNKFFISRFYWGPYTEIIRIRNKKYAFYDSYNYLFKNIKALKDSAVIICDPNNPLGDKYPDDKLINLISLLEANNVIAILDIPYRKLLINEPDFFYEFIKDFKNVVLIESFSKSLGLSGQRIGFLHCVNNNFLKEVTLRLLYESLGTNAFAQILIRDLLGTTEGKEIIAQYRMETINNVRKNINYLFENNLIANNFYKETFPIGVFVIVNRTEDELLKKNIGSLSLSHFTKTNKDEVKGFSRICVEVIHEKFVNYFIKII